jgi:prolipoprotein diacylglyceryl transferase
MMIFSPLYVVWDFNPVLFTVGGIDIRYYGLMWALAIFIGAKFFDNFCKREQLSASVSESIFVYGTLGTIIGSRLGHCLFYEPQHYLAHPLGIITEIRNGGMASHGAAIGLLIGLWLFSRRNRLPYIWSLDRIMIPVAIGGAGVRLGNLFNSEIIGCVTDVPWGFKFVRLYRNLPLEAIPVQHPTQLYEALCYVVTFGLLLWLYYRRNIGIRRPGLLFGVGLIGIFLTRFLIEFIKEDQEAFEQGMLLNMGQLLSIPFIVFGIGITVWALTRPEVQPIVAKPRAKRA